jgi:RNA polymerase sigma factor (sigma-70 family)
VAEPAEITVPCSREERDRVVEAFLPELRQIAVWYAKEHGLDEGDCIQEGTLALLSAASRRGVALTTAYAKKAIRNALFHFLTRELKEQGTVHKEVETENGETEKQWVNLARPVQLDMRDEELDVAEVPSHFGKKKHVSLPPLHKPIADPNSPDPEREALCAELTLAVRYLPALAQKVLMLKYGEGLTVREIASVLRIDKSKVQRTLDEAKEELQKKFETKPKIHTLIEYRENETPSGIAALDEKAA